MCSHYLLVVNVAFFVICLLGSVISKNIIKQFMLFILLLNSAGMSLAVFNIYLQPNNVCGLNAALYVYFISLITILLGFTLISSLFKENTSLDIGLCEGTDD